MLSVDLETFSTVLASYCTKRITYCSVFLLIGNSVDLKMRPLSIIQRAQIIALLEEGFSQRYIARQIGVNQSAVSRIGARYRQTGELEPADGQGRRRMTTVREDRAITRFVEVNPVTTARRIGDAVLPGRQISDQTLRNRLHEVGLRSRSRARVPSLTITHRRARLEYARGHIEWTERQWANVLFTDESRFCLFGNDARVRVWRRRGRRFDRACVAPVRAFNGGSVMVWGGITSRQRTDLVIMPPPGMTAVRYIDEVLRPHVVPMSQQMGRNFILMQDNARPHTAAVTREFLRENEIQLLPHPAVSPDLNPIEHIWDIMGRRLRDLARSPANLQDLSEALIRIWNEIPQEEIRACVNMRTRLREVIAQRGGNTSF